MSANLTMAVPGSPSLKNEAVPPTSGTGPRKLKMVPSVAFENAPSPMVVTLAGIVISVSE